MLNTLETYLSEAIRPALPQSIMLTAGPALPPVLSQIPLINVAATTLQPLRLVDDRETGKREPAYFSQRLSLDGDGQRLDFALPADAKGELVEIELASGRLARHGDDYWLEGNIVRFYQAPAGSFSVLLKGARARGYQELSPCRVQLQIHAWAAQMAQADSLLAPALAAALAAFIDLDRVELVRLESNEFSLRLLKPLAEVHALERTAVPAEQPLYRGSAQLCLQGEWELTLALGTAFPAGLIQVIDNRLRVKDGFGV